MSIGFQPIAQYSLQRDQIKALESIRQDSLIPDYMKAAKLLFPTYNLVPVEISGFLSGPQDFGYVLHGKLTLSTEGALTTVWNGKLGTNEFVFKSEAQRDLNDNPNTFNSGNSEYIGTFTRVQASLGAFHFIGYAVKKTTGTVYPGLPGAVSATGTFSSLFTFVGLAVGTETIELYRNGVQVARGVVVRGEGVADRINVSGSVSSFTLGEKLELKFFGFSSNTVVLELKTASGGTLVSTQNYVIPDIGLTLDISSAYLDGVKYIGGSVSKSPDWAYLDCWYSVLTVNSVDQGTNVPAVELRWKEDTDIGSWQEDNIFVHDGAKQILPIRKFTSNSLAELHFEESYEGELIEVRVYYDEENARANTNLLYMWSWGDRSGPTYMQDIKSMLALGPNVCFVIKKIE